MRSDEKQYLMEVFEWNSQTTFNLLQSGENDTYVVHAPGARCALRRYRPNRYTLQQVRAEVEWMNMIRKSIRVPQIIKNKFSDAVTTYSNSIGDTLYVAFEFIEGETIDTPTSSDYQKLGQLLRCLHDSSDEILNNAATDWTGWNRPEYDLHQMVQQPLQCLLNFGALTGDDCERCINIAQELTHRFEFLDPSRHFIHADLHFGNVLTTPSGWYCLDFDECGFGHRSLDLGVIRLHLRAAAQTEECWANFQQGYGEQLKDEEIRLGTGLRIFYMAGKIPMRQDIADLRHQPADRIRRYLGYVESELHIL